MNNDDNNSFSDNDDSDLLDREKLKSRARVVLIQAAINAAVKELAREKAKPKKNGTR
jgi:hypothetical protein